MNTRPTSAEHLCTRTFMHLNIRAQHKTLENSTKHNITEQDNTTEYNTIQHNTMHNIATQHRTLQSLRRYEQVCDSYLLITQ